MYRYLGRCVEHDDLKKKIIKKIITLSPVQNARLCLDAPPVGHFIDTLRVSVNTGGGASRIWAGVIQISTVIDLILGL